MGIRFFCPNGHKMNVKAFLAGQRGICPVCGVKMQIPLQSTRASTRAKRSEGESPEPSPFTQTDPIDEPNTSDTLVAAAGSVLGGSPSSELTFDQSSVVWYVQVSPEDDPVGPISSDDVQRRLVEGNLMPGSLVWHEGWSEWKAAADVFPELSMSKVVIPGLEDFLANPAASPLHEAGHPSHGPSRKIRRIAWSVLAAIILMLGAASFIVWMNR